MKMLKVQTWRPDTHAGHIAEIEWEYDLEAGRDTGREHRGVSILYPDGTHIHRDTHGPEVADEHYKKLHAEHVIKNQAYGVIVESLPDDMKKPVLDRDCDPVLDDAGRPRLAVKDKHMPSFEHLGSGGYAFIVPGVDEMTYNAISAKLAAFGDRVILRKPGAWGPIA